MALFYFSGCTDSNNIGDLNISATTSIANDWILSGVPVTLNTTVTSGMCYTWNGTTGTTGDVDIFVDGTLDYNNKPCTGCTDSAIRITGCTGQGTWILSSDTDGDGEYGDIGDSGDTISNTYIIGGFI